MIFRTEQSSHEKQARWPLTTQNTLLNILSFFPLLPSSWIFLPNSSIHKPAILIILLPFHRTTFLRWQTTLFFPSLFHSISMLDLNLRVLPGDFTSGGTDLQPFNLSPSAVESPISSSVLNADHSNVNGDDDSSSNADCGFTFSFSILNNSNDDQRDRKAHFPVAGGFSSDVYSQRKGVDSDFVRATNGIMVQQSAHPVKKGRRGPKSRSSQYRGVTYYRRTGRWESHIWFVISKSRSIIALFSSIDFQFIFLGLSLWIGCFYAQG